MIETPEFRFVEATHKYFLGNLELPSVTGILDSHGLISPFAKNERAALRGSKAHIACRYLMEKRLDWSTVGMMILPYVISCDRWLQESAFEVEACEVMLYHKLLLFAGTYDFKGKHAKRGRGLLDLKTGETCEISHPIQTSGYEILEGGHFFRGCLHLQKNGSRAKFIPHRQSSDRANFMSCLNVFRLKEAA